MNDYLLYICVGVLCALAIASIVALAWLLDDRKAYRERAAWERETAAKKDWFRDPRAGQSYIRANRDRDCV